MMETAFDGLLGATLLWLAWRALTTPDLFKAVVLFIAFGLAMALAWVRLGAPDIALAEAAVGAGLTGALMLDAVAQIGRAAPDRLPRARRLLIAALSLTMAGGLMVAAFQMPRDAGLTAAVAGTLDRSGVSQPVTAVLLNFRALDTWLELGVLLLAVLALLALRQTVDLSDVSRMGTAIPVLAGLAAVLVPLMILMAGYLLWLGTHAAGGAFQAGAVLGGAGVLSRVAGHRGLERLGPHVFRLAIASGVGTFLVVGLGLLSGGRGLLEYPTAHARLLIVAIEAAAAVAIGVTLTALFVGATPAGRRPGA